MAENYADMYMNLCDLSYKQTLMFREMEVDPKFVTISTITMIANLNSQLNLENFVNFNNPTPECIIRGCVIEKGKKRTNKEKKSKNTFFNQATIKFTDHTTKSIKVFSNGKLQMTGITSFQEGVKVSDMVCKYIQNTDHVIPYKNNIFVSDLEVAMINSNFSLNCGIDIMHLQNLLSDDYHTIYEPDVYPALKIRLPQSNILAFSTGHIIITTSKHLSDITETYRMFTDTLLDNWDDLKSRRAVVKKQKEVYSYTEGYIHKEWLAASR